MTNTTLEVKGMTCKHCEAAVERVLKNTPGVTTVAVDRLNNSAVVEWDETKSTREKLVAAVNDLGYQAK